MSSLTAADMPYLEKILDMGSGYVLNFTDFTFEEFFNQYSIDIHGDKYRTYGTSKAKKMRAFWKQEPDALVRQALSELLDTYIALCASTEREQDSISLRKSREIVDRLIGKFPDGNYSNLELFLNKEFEIPNLQQLPVDFAVYEIIKTRLTESQLCLSIGANLSVIFLAGSILEAALLGAAQRQPEAFNRSTSSPKQDGKVKAFPHWSLSELINVAHDIGLLKPDILKFSHGLRDFRNYIHPYQQMLSDFKPDEYTAKVCFHVLKAALADLAGER